MKKLKWTANDNQSWNSKFVHELFMNLHLVLILIIFIILWRLLKALKTYFCIALGAFSIQRFYGDIILKTVFSIPS